ncbi:MAG: short-chain dehydrogenase [Citrobacter freundii]|nr:MAG: short-chain dehydrogenase [Citrobacter freundii]
MATSKIVLITGGSRGLGKNMAIAAARKGLDVVITYHTNKTAADETIALIEDAGQRAAALQLDTGKASGFDHFSAELKKTLADKFGADRFDFLVNNAGIGIHVPFTDTAEEQFDELFNIHYKGVYFLTQKMLPLMNDGGGIINISSGLARFATPGYSAYGSMKGAIETLTRYQAKELGARGIKANVVAPGAIETDFGGGHVRDNAQMNQFIAGVTALGRVGLPDDIGGVVAFLCTPDAGWINAQRIEVSGGMFV